MSRKGGKRTLASVGLNDGLVVSGRVGLGYVPIVTASSDFHVGGSGNFLYRMAAGVRSAWSCADEAADLEQVLVPF